MKENECVVMEADESRIIFAYDLFMAGVDMDILGKVLKNHGIELDMIIHSAELTDGEKIQFLQTIGGRL